MWFGKEQGKANDILHFHYLFYGLAQMLDFLSQQDISNSNTPLPCEDGGGRGEEGVGRDLSGGI